MESKPYLSKKLHTWTKQSVSLMFLPKGFSEFPSLQAVLSILFKKEKFCILSILSVNFSNRQWCFPHPQHWTCVSILTIRKKSVNHFLCFETAENLSPGLANHNQVLCPSEENREKKTEALNKLSTVEQLKQKLILEIPTKWFLRLSNFSNF